MAELGEEPQWRGGEIPEEELTKYQQMMGDVERREQERIEQLANEIKEKCSYELNDKAQNIAQDYNQCFEKRMKELEQRYESHAASNISSRQVEVLRLNKIIRDVSRAIGDNWRVVFPKIMKNFPDDVVQAEITKIERQRPFMQGYKALTTWKELSGEEIQLVPLIEALRACESIDLVERVLDIMDADRETLLNMGEFKTGNDNAEERKSRLGQQTGDGGVGDSNLLKISRQLTKEWEQLGKMLGVADDEIAEIKENEQGYQAAFKVLWTWRENAREAGTDHEAADQLITALNRIGKRDLAAMIQSDTPATTA